MLLTLSSRPLAPVAAARRLSSVGGAAHAPLPRASGGAAAAAAAKPARRTRLARAASANLSPDSAFTPELKKAIDAFIADHKVVLFIKGTKDFPQCGFSQTTVNIFRALSVPFETVNVLEDDALRNGMKQYSGWPTFPQVYLGGELVGGADIAIQLFQSGELAEMVEAAFAE